MLLPVLVRLTSQLAYFVLQVSDLLLGRLDCVLLAGEFRVSILDPSAVVGLLALRPLTWHRIDLHDLLPRILIGRLISVCGLLSCCSNADRGSARLQVEHFVVLPVLAQEVSVEQSVPDVPAQLGAWMAALSLADQPKLVALFHLVAALEGPQLDGRNQLDLARSRQRVAVGNLRVSDRLCVWVLLASLVDCSVLLLNGRIYTDEFWAKLNMCQDPLEMRKIQRRPHKHRQ